MGLRGQLQRFARQLDAEDNNAFDLWTWLPSYHAAKKSHGDYSTEFTPEIADILKEATLVMAALAGNTMNMDLVYEWFGCPCGQCEIDRKEIQVTFFGVFKQALFVEDPTYYCVRDSHDSRRDPSAVDENDWCICGMRTIKILDDFVSLDDVASGGFSPGEFAQLGPGLRKFQCMGCDQVLIDHPNRLVASSVHVAGCNGCNKD